MRAKEGCAVGGFRQNDGICRTPRNPCEALRLSSRAVKIGSQIAVGDEAAARSDRLTLVICFHNQPRLITGGAKRCRAINLILDDWQLTDDLAAKRESRPRPSRRRP